MVESVNITIHKSKNSKRWLLTKKKNTVSLGPIGMDKRQLPTKLGLNQIRATRISSHKSLYIYAFCCVFVWPSEASPKETKIFLKVRGLPKTRGPELPTNTKGPLVRVPGCYISTNSCQEPSTSNSQSMLVAFFHSRGGRGFSPLPVATGITLYNNGPCYNMEQISCGT